MQENSSEHETVSQDGHEITFHPAFARRCAVTSGGRETELYQQKEVHYLPEGQEKPPTQHRLHYRSQKAGQEFTLTVHDPNLRIARVVVELYGEDHVPGAGNDDATVETVTVDNGPVICPPSCV
ncbi:MAG: hypothetical protein M3418_05125 [Gemmatimonadota bacterium]|nr:hypothetical protein [Gemmatimonadota bacterium]